MGKQLTLSDRIAIETGIAAEMSFKEIADQLGKHPSTISLEVRNNRTFVEGSYRYGNNCRYAKCCIKKSVCGKAACTEYCANCHEKDCHFFCKQYVSSECLKWEWPPYVCNACDKRKNCTKSRYFYSAKFADAAVTRRRSESRQGIHLTDDELHTLDELVCDLINKGQPLAHIYAEHKDEFPITLRTLYNYIDDNRLTVRNIDLRRKVGYKARRKPRKESDNFFQQDFRRGREYDDFERYIKNHPNVPIIEMDTVKGQRRKGKCLLTMIFRENSIMLLFLLPDGKAESVKRVFDFLEIGLGEVVFRRIFPLFFDRQRE